MSASQTPVQAQQIQAAYQQAVRLQNAGQIQQAAQIYTAILKQRELAEPCFQMGRIAARAGRKPEAATWFRRALKLKPRQIEIWAALIEVLTGRDKAEAVAEARRLGVILSEKTTTTIQKALAEVRAGCGAKAEKLFLQAIKDAADPVAVWEAWSRGLYESHHVDAALAVIGKGLAAQPGEARLLVMRASMLETSGRLDAAEADLRAVLDTKPYHPRAWLALMRLRRQAPGAPEVDTLERRVAEAGSDPEAVRHMSFALAKALEDQGRDDEVFRHLDRANSMTRKRFPWGFDEDHGFLRDAIAAWTPREDGHAGSAPIFVTGLPRSGTTLVETILAAHPQIAAGGEAGLLSPILHPAVRDWFTARTPFDAAAIGRTYVEGMTAKLGDDAQGRRITDKSISTYAALGYTRDVLPDAKFVVLERDRRDVGLSIYKNLFRDGTHRYANDLTDIARQIRLFDAAIAAWRARMPEAIHVLDYDALTADPEPHVRALLEFCGLSWDPACLAPERTDRKVMTLSSVQVRQPINRGSVGAWRRFEGSLTPLIEALETTRYSFG
ncbi:tetratricopeptide repeat-containing sulfotransferase family protein [Roseicyclus mahoneyensis]|uniref:Tetratricopeptide repeat protein n=1 Tax=Roseicyclus mahoneyensis TaxID=164332 RepID=A0A316GEW0_9RHOB|nr:tetratricopeptide repeat-containing sulfotransferase family protein [Roseicyclus mahoneyensis]PWK59531.1 tetratricopeptide repeat protein [Roseicyclus mahoneyensis]